MKVVEGTSEVPSAGHPGGTWGFSFAWLVVERQRRSMVVVSVVWIGTFGSDGSGVTTTVLRIPYARDPPTGVHYHGE